MSSCPSWSMLSSTWIYEPGKLQRLLYLWTLLVMAGMIFMARSERRSPLGSLTTNQDESANQQVPSPCQGVILVRWTEGHLWALCRSLCDES